MQTGKAAFASMRQLDVESSLNVPTYSEKEFTGRWATVNWAKRDVFTMSRLVGPRPIYVAARQERGFGYADAESTTPCFAALTGTREISNGIWVSCFGSRE